MEVGDANAVRDQFGGVAVLVQDLPGLELAALPVASVAVAARRVLVDALPVQLTLVVELPLVPTRRAEIKKKNIESQKISLKTEKQKKCTPLANTNFAKTKHTRTHTP